jgi:membrane dipeptidase
MKKLILLLCTCTTIVVHAQSVAGLHAKAVVVDTHNDVLTEVISKKIDISHRLTVGHSDLDRWEQGGLDVQFFSVWTDKVPRNKEGFFADAVEEIDTLHHILLRNPTRMRFATNYREVKRGIRQEKLVALIGVEGGHMIENDMSKLEQLYEKGMRYLTLTWNNSTPWASSAMDETLHPENISQKGLTEFGRQIIKRMNELGIIVDLSHTGEQTFYDAIAASSKPVLLSHSSVWNICPVFRNVKDDQIKAVAKNGGVICINFYPGFISKEYDERSTYLNGPRKKSMQDSIFLLLHDSTAMKASWDKYYDAEMDKVRPALAQVVDHIDYIVKLAGIDYVGIGSDYDGIGSVPIGLEDVTTYPRITEELVKRGYTNSAIKKILGGNVMRVMKANFK